MIRGLFVGIDRYRAPVNRLGCAVADAQALGALFEDTLGGEIAVLTDDAADRSAILAGLTKLSQAGSDDLVVVSFSGHGSDDHRLCPVDIDVDDIEGSCIGLDLLAEHLDRIPSKHLLVFLDCCFAGGFGGARVFAPVRTRSPQEDRSTVVALAKGSGRIVFMASAAGEPALETAASGHGLFTFQLLAGLQGEGDLPTDGRISLLSLADFVSNRVVEEARRMREVQTPTVYGSVDGAPTLPVLVPGARYASIFPERVREPVTADWSSLASYGIPEVIINRWAAAMPGLNELQQQAVNSFGVLDGKSLLVVAPTGSGKTFVGELAAFKAVAGGGRAVMLLPMRALVNDKYDAFTQTYGDQAVIVRATGEHSDQVGAILSGQYDLALLTYEKFMNLALGFPHIMRGISVVVVDEAQVIGDRGRGPSLEFLLALLRSGYARGEAVQIVALSAVIGDTNGLETWLGGSLLRTTDRPVPLSESVLDASGALHTLQPGGEESHANAFVQPELHGGSQSSKPWIIPVVRRLVSEGKKIIVFRSFRGETVGTARYLADALGLRPADDTLNLLPEGDRSAASEDLRYTLQNGVAFHNSDLDRDERAALETTFRDPTSPLRIIVATSTLAMGVNTPAEAVVIAGLNHPGGVRFSVAEYKNMVGRAGRPGFSTAGESVLVATDDLAPNDAWNNYVKGSPEAIESHFLSPGTDPQTLILRSLVALGASVEEGELLALLDSSFAIWRRVQQGQPGWDPPTLQADLNRLIQARLLDREPTGHLTLTQLGRYAGESGIEVRSVTNVSSLLRYAPHDLSVADVITIAQVTVEMDQQFLPANAKSHQEQRRWPTRLHQLGLHSQLLGGLHVGGGNTFMRTKCAVAAMLYMSSIPMSQIEAELMQHTRGSSAAGQVRSVAGRTRDVLDAVCRIAELSGFGMDAASTVEDLTLRLEIGLPAELVELGHVLGSELTRAQYLSLLASGITSPTAARDSQPVLVTLLGRPLGERVAGKCQEAIDHAAS